MARSVQWRLQLVLKLVGARELERGLWLDCRELEIKVMEGMQLSIMTGSRE